MFLCIDKFFCKNRQCIDEFTGKTVSALTILPLRRCFNRGDEG